MKTLQLIVLTLLSYTTALEFTHKPLSDEYINAINNKQTLWKAGRNFDPDTQLSDLKVLLGAVERPTDGIRRIHHVKDIDIPENFDARQVWDQCQSIKRIYDQSHCGSCWVSDYIIF